jgi:hypothetical protein
MKKPELFSLIKLKLLNNGGVEITYREQNRVGGITNTIDWTTKSSITPHPDLNNKVDELKQFLAKCYDLDSMVILSNSKGLKLKDSDAMKQIKGLIADVYNQNLQKIDVTGISLSGEVDEDKDKRSVVITGTKLQHNGTKTALNSPRIKLANTQFNFEAEVQEIVEAIEEEVKEYLFENKKSQPELFDAPKEEKLSKEFIEGKMQKVG